MPRGVAAVVAFLLLAAPVGAQTPPPDDRAAARAFADAALRFQAAIEPILETRFEPERERRCSYRARRRIAEHRWDEVILLHSFEDEHRSLAQAVTPALTQLSIDLHAVATADPALRAGRTGVRRVRRMYADVAAVPRYDVCAEIERWVDGDFRPTPVLRRVQQTTSALDRAIEDGDIERRACRMVLRLRELGIPEREAGVFYEGGEDACAA
jgi:hypothetical protein